MWFGCSRKFTGSCYIRSTCDLGETPSAHGFGLTYRAESIELRGPLGLVCGATAGTERIPDYQHAGWVPHQRIPAFLHGSGAFRWTAGGPLLTQVDHCWRSHLLERPHAADRSHAHLYGAADSSHARGYWRGYVRDNCPDVCCRPVSRGEAGANSGRVLSGDSGGDGGGISSWRQSSPAPWLEIPILCGGGSGISAGAAGAVFKRAGARTIRLGERNTRAGHAAWFGKQSGVLDGHPGDGNDDVCPGRVTSLDANIFVAGARIFA